MAKKHKKERQNKAKQRRPAKNQSLPLNNAPPEQNNTLATLPQELRDRIFEYLLVPPNRGIMYRDPHVYGKNIQGGMEIIPFNNNKHPTVPTKEQAENQKPIHYHGLLLTCRSFFHQTRHILCSKNTFVGLPNINNIRCGPTSALYNIESIVFNCRIEVREDDKKIDFIQNSLKKALDFCKPWAKVKTLKRLKLAFPHYEGDGTSSYAQFLNDAKERPLAPNTWLNYMFQEIDARYCRFVINRMCLVGKIFSNSVVKPQIYAFRYLCLTPGSRLPYPKEYDVRYATALMQELHLRLRMPLFVDGRLCYKEGIEYAKPFEVILP